MATPEDTVRRFYDALGRGDVPAVVSLLDEDVRWTEAVRFPYYSGTWTSPQQVVDNLLVPLARDWEGFAATPREFVVAGDRVVSLGSYTGRLRATGRTLDVPYAHAWRVKGGRVATFDMYVDTAKVLDCYRPA